MDAIKLLTRNRVVLIHRDQIDRYGGSAGVRDEGLLESALARPATSFGGHAVYASVPEVAAAYMFYLVKTIPSSTAINALVRQRRCFAWT